MQKLREILRSRRGETLVELMLSVVIILLIMAVLVTSVSFANNAQRKAEAIQNNAAQLQRDLRQKTPVSAGSAAYSFKAISVDGSQTGRDVLFSVNVTLQTVTATGTSGNTTFYVFGEGGGG